MKTKILFTVITLLIFINSSVSQEREVFIVPNLLDLFRGGNVNGFAKRLSENNFDVQKLSGISLENQNELIYNKFKDFPADDLIFCESIGDLDNL